MIQLSNALIVAHKFPHTPDSNCGDVYMLDMMTRCSDWQGAEENLHLVNFLGATCLQNSRTGTGIPLFVPHKNSGPEY